MSLKNKKLNKGYKANGKNLQEMPINPFAKETAPLIYVGPVDYLPVMIRKK